MTSLDLPTLRALADELRSPAVFNRAVMVRGADAILALLDRLEEAEAKVAEAWDEGFMACADWWEIHHAQHVLGDKNSYRKGANEAPQRVLVTHPHNGHGENDICMYCLKGANDDQ